MKIYNFVIMNMPFILVFFIFYLIYNLITKKQKIKKLCNPVIFPILIMSIVLVVYYWPVRNILAGYNIETINIMIKHQNVQINDKAKVNKILETVNKYKFTRSAFRSIIQKVYAGDYLIAITTQDLKRGKFIELCVLNDLITENAPPSISHGPEENELEINGQAYECSDNNGLSIDIYNLIKDYADWDTNPA